MLDALSIKNFKAWRDTGPIRLAPITVFFGSNSAGKTSLLQFLLMLKQTAESHDRKRVLHPGDRNTPVELGTIRDLIYAHDFDNQIEFTLRWGLPQPLEVINPKGKRRYCGDSLQFRAGISVDHRTSQPVVVKMDYELVEGTDKAQFSMGMQRYSGSESEYEVHADSYSLVRFQGRGWKPGPPDRFFGFPDSVFRYYQNIGVATDLASALVQEFDRIFYLGPLRIYPERTYMWAGDEPEHVGWRGERAVEALLAGSSRRFSPGPRKWTKSLPQMVEYWLQQLGLLKKFEAKPIARNRKEHDVFVRAHGSSQDTTLADVGFGVSQVLPVIVQSYYARPNSTIIMEQPELHLHPRVQSEVAELFIDAIHSLENGAPRQVQFIIESHSEHLLRRLQRRIAEGTLRREEVALYFCVQGTEGAKLEELKVDEDGDILNWPEGFFGNDMEDLTARLEAAAKRQEASSNG